MPSRSSVHKSTANVATPFTTGWRNSFRRMLHLTLVARLLVKLGVAAASAVDVTLHPGAEFDARQVTLARAYDDTLSLKLLDYDNIGFTKKGKKVGYEQFIALAFKQ